MNDATIGLIGGLAGTVLGCLDGIIGSYFSIQNTHGPRERAFMVKSCAAAWMARMVFQPLAIFFMHMQHRGKAVP